MKWFGRKSKQAITEVSVEGPSDPLVVEENVLQKSILDLQDEITTQFIEFAPRPNDTTGLRHH